MASILVATGFVRIDADATPATKALKSFGAVGSQALTTTLLPALAAVSAGLLSVASAAAVAGGAVSAYGAAVAPQFKMITEANQKLEASENAKEKATVQANIAQQLAKKHGFEYGKQVEITASMSDSAKEAAKEYNSALSAQQTASKAATKAQLLYKEDLKAMPPATRQTADALQKLKDASKEWSNSLAGDTMPLFTRGIQFLTNLLPKLTPIVKDVADELDVFVNSLRVGVAGQVFQQFGDNIKTNGAGALGSFLAVVKNITVGFVGLLNTFMPMSKGVQGGLVGLTEKFALWGATSQNSPGLQKMMQIAKDSIPSFVALGKAIADVVSAAGPLSGVGLKVLTVFAQIIDAIPTPVLKLLVPAIIAVNLALKAYAIYQAAATGATWLFTTSVTTSTGVVYSSRLALIAHRIILILHAAATAITTAATWLWTAATVAATVAVLILKGALLVLKVAMLLTFGAVKLLVTGLKLLAYAILTNPIALIITLIVLLVAAFVIAYKKSETFRNIVHAALNAVKDAALAVAAWFSGPFVQFFVDAWGKVMQYFVNPIKNFFTVTLPNAAKTTKEKVTGWWNAAYQGLLTTWNFIKTKILQPIITFFTVNIPNGVRNGRDRIVGWWNSMATGLSNGYTWIKTRVFQPIGNFFTQTIPGWARTMNQKVQGWFTAMRDGIGSIWNGIKEKAKAPINWVLKNVWNNGIQNVWGKIAGWIGIDNKLKDVQLLAAGGTVGNRPFGLFNRPTAIVGEGNPNYPEYVIPTDPKYATRARGLWESAGTHFMADGGIIGSIGDAVGKAASSVKGVVKGAADFFTDPTAAAKKLFNGVLGKLSGLGSSPWAKMASRLPHMAVDGLMKAVKNVGSSLLGAVGLGSGNGGSGVARWGPIVQILLRMLGQPAAYKDLTLRRMNQESGGNPTIVNKWDSNWQAGHPSVGLMQVIRGTFQAYAGKYRNTGPFLYGVSVDPAANIYASMRYALSRYGSLPAAYNRPGGYANGTGGTTAGMHLFGENGPELGFTPAGWRILNTRRSAALAGGGVMVIEKLVLENHGVIASRREALDWLAAAQDQLRRRNRI